VIWHSTRRRYICLAGGAVGFLKENRAFSRSSKRKAGITRTPGDGEESETLGEGAIAPTYIKPRFTKKRGRREAPRK